MAVHGGGSKERPWSDLPSDLLSYIYLRSVSTYDRARFAAVCSPWRAAAAWHPRLPALPLLLLSTGDGERDREARAYSLEDGKALRLPLPWFPWGNRLVGSYQGGWIATVSGSDVLLVVNVFSGARAARLPINKIFIRKIVFSKDPSSSGCVIAAMTSRCTVALRRVGYPDSWWVTWCGLNTYGDLLDIVFCNGELYGVTSGGELIMFGLGVNKEGALVAIRVFRIKVAPINFYIVELTSTLRVFQLADNDTTTSHRYKWAEVTSLGDHALFLGPANCKAVHISTAGQRGGLEGNRIYYSKQHTYLQNSMECLARLDLGNCTVHCWESESKHHLVSQSYHYRKNQDGANACVWLWPPDL